MTPEIFLSLVLFAFTTSVTPGPNNMMLLASGVNFGMRRTIPHMIGIELGFASLLAAVGFGLGALFQSSPTLYIILKICGGLYLLWIAWSIGMSRSLGSGKSSGEPMRLSAAAAFQWVNPKAWVMAISSMAAFADPARPGTSVAIVTRPSSLSPCRARAVGPGSARYSGTGCHIPFASNGSTSPWLSCWC